MLVNRYRIAKDRIVAEGQGVGYMFEEPDWNRVSICTINTRRMLRKESNEPVM